MKRPVRSDDYYGGDVWVDTSTVMPNYPDGAVEICWEAWGG